MDHLTWLWEIQEKAADGTLPELPRMAFAAALQEAEVSALGGGSRSVGQGLTRAAWIAAVESLREKWETAQVAEHAAHGAAAANRQAEPSAASAAAVTAAAQHGRAAAGGIGVGLGVGMGPTMEEISRFFEIDARRF